ncbi:enoyl-CoA hydratase/isomerase family protein [Nocardiopsis nanhaiensis]
MKTTEASYETFTLEEPATGVVVMTLNRPGSYNAMTNTMFREFEDLAWEVDQDDEIRVLVMTGAGRAFCSGYDLGDVDELPQLGAMGMLDQQERAARSLLALRSIRVPCIAAVNGPAAGGGMSLALAADIRLASESARFNAAFVKIGLSAGDLGASWLLTRLVGPGHAAEIAYTGRQVGAEEALRLGLVTSVHPDTEVVQAAVELAASITGNSPTGVQLSKRALHANMEAASYAGALELENRGQALLTRTQDMGEALAAFKEKRTPNYIGA